MTIFRIEALRYELFCLNSLRCLPELLLSGVPNICRKMFICVNQVIIQSQTNPSILQGTGEPNLRYASVSSSIYLGRFHDATSNFLQA